MSDVPAASPPRHSPETVVHRRTRRALIWKEWVEHRWRFALGALVLSVLLGGMLRAQIVPFHEAAVTVYWPIGTIMAIFLAMGPVAIEKTGRTWEFLLAQPIERRRILLAKWRLGLGQLLGMIAVSAFVGALAMWSRGFYGRVTFWQKAPAEQQMGVGWLQTASGHPVLWLLLLAIVAMVVLACWYTFLFVILLRARNEFEAALGGALLTIAAHTWLGHLTEPNLRIVAGLNPFAEFVVLNNPAFFDWVIYMIPAHIAVWIGLPLLFLGTRR